MFGGVDGEVPAGLHGHPVDGVVGHGREHEEEGARGEHLVECGQHLLVLFLDIQELLVSFTQGCLGLLPRADGRLEIDR